MIHPLLQRPIQMRIRLRRRTEPHRFTQVIPPLLTKLTLVAHDTRLDSDALADAEVCDARAECGDDACGFVAEDERVADGEVAVAAVEVVVDCDECVSVSVRIG